MGVVVTLMFLLLALVVGISLMARYYGNTLDLDVRWLIGALIVSFFSFSFNGFCLSLCFMVG